MAIDSREKRQAVASIKQRLTATVTPSATQDQAWRQEVGWGYPGILADSPPAAPVDVARSRALWASAAGMLGGIVRW